MHSALRKFWHSSVGRYLYACYDTAGCLYLLDGGEVVGTYVCGEGVWQGDPLGNPCFSMAIYTFMEKLKALCRPEASLQKGSNGVPHAWIVDDCTLVPSRRRALEVVRFIIEQGPAHGLFPNMQKFHAWFVKSDQGSRDVVVELERMGVHVSDGGLDRLLGAPIGTSAFCIQPGGHMVRITAQASDFISAISTIPHSQAQYHLLRWCASNSLHHCPRLLPPHIVRVFAENIVTISCMLCNTCCTLQRH